MFTRTSAPCPPPLLLRPGNRAALLLLVLSSLLCVFVSAVSGAEAGSAAKAAAGSPAKARPVWTFTPDPALPNVLILGDSISVGYTLGVRARLAGRANVFRPLQADRSGPENCQGTTLGAKRVAHWLTGRKWDVIHFNWGLHDLKHVKISGTSENSDEASDPVQASIPAYVENLRQIITRLQATGARLVFATTTPVVPDTRSPLRSPDSPPAYNAAAITLMKANGIRVNDLFALTTPKLSQLQLPRNVHFTAAGSDLLATEVARIIGEELAGRRKPAVSK